MDNTRYIDLCAAGLYRQMQHAAAKVLEETKGRYSSQSWLGPKATGTALQAVQWLPTQGRYPPHTLSSVGCHVCRLTMPRRRPQSAPTPARQRRARRSAPSSARRRWAALTTARSCAATTGPSWLGPVAADRGSLLGQLILCKGMENCTQVKSSQVIQNPCFVRYEVLQQRYKAPELGAYIILIDITPRSVRSNRVVHVRWNRTVSASSGTVHSQVTWEVRGGGGWSKSGHRRRFASV
jgi:hypothetical protein